MVNGLFSVTWNEFWRMNPRIINALHRGYEYRIKEQDCYQYIWWEQYGYTAVKTAIEQCLFGAKAKISYPKEPILANAERQNSEAELEKQRELFVLQLEVMKANFEMNHPKE